MSGFEWESVEGVLIIKRMLELRSDDMRYSEADIAQTLSQEFDIIFTRNQIHHQLYKLRDYPKLSDKQLEFRPYYTKYKAFVDGDKKIPKKPFPASPDMNILSLNDLHVPYQIETAVQEAVNQNINSDVLVLSEMLDMFSLNSFGQTDNIPLEYEIEQGLRLLEYFSETFPYVIIIEGNHDNGRVLRKIAQRLPPAMLFLVETNILERLAAPFANVKVIPFWAVKINDAVFTHALVTSVVPMSSGNSTYNHFIENNGIEYDMGEWSVIVQAHTHHQGVIFRNNTKIMETGCLCKAYRYFLAKPRKRSWDRGWVCVVQRNGKTLLNKTHVYHYNYVPEASPLQKL